MLPGLIVAYPHPSAISCCVAGGSDAAAGAPGAPPGAPTRPGPKPGAAGGVPGAGGMPERPPNIIITGTGVVASAGVTTVIWMSTVTSGNAALSTGPTTSLPITGRPPTTNLSVRATFQLTFGTLAGTRPSTSRSNASTISGLRSFHQASAVATFLPLSRVSGSGS